MVVLNGDNVFIVRGRGYQTKLSNPQRELPASRVVSIALDDQC